MTGIYKGFLSNVFRRTSPGGSGKRQLADGFGHPPSASPSALPLPLDP
jgi:hypothetical protein